MTDKPVHIVGLDLGQQRDYSALVVAEGRRAEANGDGDHGGHYALRHLHRWPLGTSYVDVVRDVAELVQKPPLSRPALVIDETGVGRAVCDLFDENKLAADLYRITIVGGHEVSGGFRHIHCPKKELVGVLQALLQRGRLKVAAELPLAVTLLEELKNFRVKMTAADGETFEAWRQKDTDDIVLAAALALWVAEFRLLPWSGATVSFGRRPKRPLVPGAVDLDQFRDERGMIRFPG